MQMRYRSWCTGIALLFTALAWLTPSLPAVAASAKAQQPCVGPGGACLSFTAAQAIPVIRGITFAAPKAGTAMVTFHGNAYCAGSSSYQNGTQYARVDLVSQIVNRQNKVPDLTKAGSLRHAAAMGGGNQFDWSTTFNLASTRLFTVNAAGTQKYYFKIARLLQDPNITCYLYNAAFTVLFTP